ncbi:MAG: sulfurtransferase [Eubacteriales bacterium]
MKQNKTLIIACLICVLTLVAVLFIISGHPFRKGVPKDAAVQPKPAGPAEIAAEKIYEYQNPNAVISVYELNDILENPDMVILDTRGITYQIYCTTYPLGHIPGAIPILHGEYCHPTYQNRIALPQQVQKYLGEIGINNSKRILLYGNDGLQARLYWMFKMYGSDNQIQIIDGGIEKWKEAGYQAVTVSPKVTPSQFEFNMARADLNIYSDMGDVIKAIQNPEQYSIIDARSREEFLIAHIPLSVNVSPKDITNSDGTFKPVQELAAIYARKGVTPDKTVIVYSNLGIRSSLNWFVLRELLGYPNVKNYDAGSYEWSEREYGIESGEERQPVKRDQ